MKNEKQQIEIKVIANAKKPEVIPYKNGYKVKVNAPAVNGEANKAVVKALAKYLKIKTRQISIVSGELQPFKKVVLQL